MKLLIAYDGSYSSEAALDDLHLAGLPRTGEAVIISIAEVWLAPPFAYQETAAVIGGFPVVAGAQMAVDAGAQATAEAEILAQHARKRFKNVYPDWRVTTKAVCGSPAAEILAEAEEFGADLIFIGSNGRSTVGRMFLGSISQKVLTEAPMSVRIARGQIEVDPVPARIIVGFDSSIGANSAIETVAARNWRAGSEVRLVAAADSIAPKNLGRFVAPVTNWVEGELDGKRKILEEIAAPALQKLRDKGLEAGFHVFAGSPKHVLVEEAERWHADSIFVGANSHGKIERFLLGSVSAAVAARASCSVEVIRAKAD